MAYPLGAEEGVGALPGVVVKCSLLPRNVLVLAALNPRKIGHLT